jgi:hypothetical protein
MVANMEVDPWNDVCLHGHYRSYEGACFANIGMTVECPERNRFRYGELVCFFVNADG